MRPRSYCKIKIDLAAQHSHTGNDTESWVFRGKLTESHCGPDQVVELINGTCCQMDIMMLTCVRMAKPYHET